MTPQKESSSKDSPKSPKTKNIRNSINSIRASSQSLQCELCKDVVSNQRQLVVHRNRFHSDLKPLHACDLLQQHVASAEHYNSNVQPPDFSCEKCDFVSKRKGALTRHYNEVHAKKTVFQCSQCSYSSSRKGNLDGHIKNVHRKSKKFICLLCSTIFQDKLGLEKHLMSSHSNGNRFKCLFCDFATSQKNALNQHIKISHDVQTFTCDHCKLSYRRKDSLSKHIREHHSGGLILKRPKNKTTAENVIVRNRSIISLSDISMQSKATDKVKYWLESNDFKGNPYIIDSY